MLGHFILPDHVPSYLAIFVWLSAGVYPSKIATNTVFLLLYDSFSFQNDPKHLDPSNKMDLDIWDCLGWVQLVLQKNFI